MPDKLTTIGMDFLAVARNDVPDRVVSLSFVVRLLWGRP
jgi:hypothetical protein